MLVTIYTDGGIRADIHSWEFRARSEKGWLSGSGTMPPTNKIELVEFEAVKQAAYTVLDKWPEAKILFFNVDNFQVVRTFWCCAGIAPGKYKITGSLHGHVPPFYKEIKAKNISIRVKHVSAHQSDGNIRSYMNNSVDELVRKQYK